MVVHICCKLLFPMCFICFSNVCASVFIWMLHMFHTYITSVLFGCYVCFTMVLRCFCKCFRYIFQVFHLSSNVCCKCYIWMFQQQMECCISLLPRLRLPLNRCLHLLSCWLGTRTKGAGECCPPLLLDASDAAWHGRRSFCYAISMVP